MHRALPAAAVLLLMFGPFADRVHPQVSRVLTGELARGDRTLRSGEFYDEHTIDGRAGQRVVVEMTATEFDPYLIVVSPSNQRQENDDWEGSNRRSRVEWVLPETGTYRLLATSYGKGEAGRYELRTQVTDAAPEGARPAGDPGARVETGRLGGGDRVMRTGEYYDEHSFQGTRGESVTIDLRSSDFDPFLIVEGPGNVRHENDDYEDDVHRSLVSFELPATGTYRITVTSYAARETGAYDLRIRQASPQAAARAQPGRRVERGRLEAGDQTLRSGEFLDAYTFEGRPGLRVTLDVSSTQFDTYLILIPPRGERQENDDVAGRPGHSAIEADVTEPGTYRVLVTSYQRGETGGYELQVALNEPSPSPSAGARPRELSAIAVGEARDGQLTAEDSRLESGEFRDAFSFDGRAGQQIVIELASRAFDPYLIVMPPQGESIDNDDWQGRTDLSRVELTLTANGRYRVLATSYEPAETGAYRLTVRDAASVAGAPGPTAGPGSRPGGVHGVFVGISDYGGRANDLQYTADDARRLYQALQAGAGMAGADGTLLVDRQATVANVRRAVQTAAQQAGPDDLFVFFFSGHGSRVPRTSPQPSDPDQLDETLSFFDADVADDDFSQWLAGLRARHTLVVLDSCFSGGFQKDVITAPGRMGLFSSQEDVLSSVAAKFRAGGYLAHFIAEAIGEGHGDLDRSGDITAIELSQYLQERYRSDVKSGGADEDYVRVGGPQTGYQHLVVDRGGIRPSEVLFLRR
jgi:hypothetical protein